MTLTEDELRSLVVGHQGIAEGAFHDALGKADSDWQGSDGLFRAEASDVSLLLAESAPVPEEIRPRNALNLLAQAFDALANELGRGFGVSRLQLHARCSGTPPHEIDRALALLTVWGSVSERADKFVRVRPWPSYNAGKERDDLFGDAAERAKAALPAVADVFARREGGHVPSEPPTDRFGRFLLKQNWNALGVWWSQTVREMQGMNEQTSPTSICVLCGALLEAALTAIAAPARDAKEWRQDFLNGSPDKWKAAQLIDQAKVSGVFSSHQAALAETLNNVRNRIHAGKFAKAGKLEPPYTEAHEATLAKHHLELLVAAILEWPTISVLA